MTPDESQAEEKGRVVYSRMLPGETGAGGAGARPAAAAPASAPPAEHQALAPALTPLLIGLTILLILVAGLGALSLGRLDAVSNSILDLQRQHYARLSLLLQLRESATGLDNEARARSEARSRREIAPPFSVRLRRARDDLKDLLPRFERMSLAGDERGRALRADLLSFLEITQDLDRYAEEGYTTFRRIDDGLEALIKTMDAEQYEVFRQSAEQQGRAKKNILFLTLVALGFGLMATVGTSVEVQRRFRQMRQGLEAARRERQFSTQILGGMVSAVVVIDARDRIRSANAVFFELYPEAAIGSSVHEKIAPPDVLKLLEAATARRPTGATYIGRQKIHEPRPASHGGVAQTFDVYASPLMLDGEQGTIVTLVDATEAAKAEAELRRSEALAAVGQAVAQVAHEIKNPIGSIRLGVSMLRDMVAEPEAITTITLVERGIDHLNKLTREITHYSRQKPLERTPTDLHALLDDSLDLVADKLRDKQTPVQKEFGEGAMEGLWDEDELRQVFVNLFSNALDASPEGAPLLISTRRVESENGHPQPFVRIQVADEGGGMDDETRAHIFEPFFTTKKRGTGLGLAIVKKIIDQHEGQIAVTSAPGAGTRFSIELPLRD